jgi:hypothetical protein
VKNPLRSPRTRRGRPAKPPPPGEKASLGLRVTAQLKQRLEDEARRQGRSQSEEAEARIELTFIRQELLGEILELTYGRQSAGLLMAIGEALRTTGGLANAMWLLSSGRSPEEVDLHNTDYHGQWLEDPRGFEAAAKSIALVLELLRPSGDEPAQGADARFKWEGIPRYVAASLLKSFRDKPVGTHWEGIRSRLGKLVARVPGKR